jgi:hypothetical protein
MRIAYFEKQTALQSEPIWKAFLNSCKSLGIIPVENSLDADCALIWSVLWKGRLLENKKVYYHYRSFNKPVFIIEVGSLIRGKTWKISINNITRHGIYPNTDNFIPNRAKKLGLTLHNYKILNNRPILIAGQHDKSLQWTYDHNNTIWIRDKIMEIRKFTNKPIHVRPHPRNYFRENFGKNIIIETPVKLANTYDQYDLNFNYHAIFNYNSGVSIQAAQHGTPIICDDSSLASEVSVTLSNIDRPTIIDRHQWFERLVHTEWTLEEIGEGIPLKRLLSKVDLTQGT